VSGPKAKHFLTMSIQEVKVKKLLRNYQFDQSIKVCTEFKKNAFVAIALSLIYYECIVIEIHCTIHRCDPTAFIQNI